jgi:hypothetical protein
VEITGTYHADQGLFEQSFANKFFYTDIENGGLTNYSVYIELPAGIDTSLERDGSPIPFTNRASISEPGAYVLQLSFPEEGGVVTGLFRFRIAAQGAAGSVPADAGDIYVDEPMMTDSEINDLFDSYLYGDAGGSVSLGGGTEALVGNGVYTGLNETYDSANGLFLETLVSGRAFYSNIPNGSVVDFPVSLNFPGQFGEIVITKDDQPYPYIPGGTIKEDGAYRLTFGSSDLSSLISGAGSRTPAFNFRLITRPTASLDIYNAPPGYRLVGVLLDGEPAPHRGNTAVLGKDGLYTLSLTPEQEGAKEWELKFRRDTAPPVFQLTGVRGGLSTGAAVILTYPATDTDLVRLFKDGEAVRYPSSENNITITEPGRYYAVVYDQAGNYTVGEFEMLYRMNGAAWLVILGMVALLAALVALILIRGRRDLRVR